MPKMLRHSLLRSMPGPLRFPGYQLVLWVMDQLSVIAEPETRCQLLGYHALDVQCFRPGVRG